MAHVAPGRANWHAAAAAAAVAFSSSLVSSSSSSSSAFASALRSTRMSLELYEKLPSKLSILYTQCPIKIVPSHD